MNNIESSVANNEDVNEIFTALVNSLLTDARFVLCQSIQIFKIFGRNIRNLTAPSCGKYFRHGRYSYKLIRLV